MLMLLAIGNLTIKAGGVCHRPSLTRVENIGQLMPSQETVVLGFFGRVENPTFDGTEAGTAYPASLDEAALTSPGQDSLLARWVSVYWRRTLL